MPVFLLLLLFSTSVICENRVIYYLNDVEYARMPLVAELDSYEECHAEPGSVYCVVEPTLVSDDPSPLLDMIKAYSAHRTTHYNHSKLLRGICLTRTCKDYITENLRTSNMRTSDFRNSDLRNGDSHDSDLRISDSHSSELLTTLESCLNASLYSQYKLKTSVEQYHCTNKHNDRQTEYDHFSLIVGRFIIAIVLVNLSGTLYHCFWTKVKKNNDTSILLCFSLRRNWNKFTSLSYNDKSLPNLKALHGMRVITMMLVIIAHTILPTVFIPEDTRIIELIMRHRLMHGILAGPYVMQTYIIMSGFLVVYNMLKLSEHMKIKWSSLPKILFLRWLRLVIAYSIMIALTVTWFGRFTSGPLYHMMVGAEIADCKKSWWSHIFMVNNFAVDRECFRQGWYISTDFQLHILAVVVFMVCRSPRARVVLPPILFAASILIPAAQTYLQDLDISVVTSPTTVIKFFKTDATFNAAYIKPQTNMSASLLGIWMAYVTHRWEKQRFDVTKYRNPLTLLLYWSLFPLAFLCCYIAGQEYGDIPRPSLIFRTVAAALIKPVFAFFIAMLMLGTFFNFDSLYRGILEWRGFRYLSQLTFSAYLLHVSLVRNYVVTMTSVMPFSLIYIIKLQVSIITLSFAASFIFWMLLEAPLGNFIKCCLQSNRKGVKKD